jgi:nucleoside-diphosphate-sugar epimerase
VNHVSAVRQVIVGFRPDHVIHLAAISRIADAAADMDSAWRPNVLGALNCVWRYRYATDCDENSHRRGRLPALTTSAEMPCPEPGVSLLRNSAPSLSSASKSRGARWCSPA